MGKAEKIHNHSRLPSADGWAMGLSGLCLVHCLALPAIALAAPAALGLETLHWEFHAAFLVGAVLLTLAAFWPSKASGAVRSRRALGLAAGGLIFMASALIGPLHQHERALTVIGVILLASAHGANWYLRAKAHAQLHASAGAAAS